MKKIIILCSLLSIGTAYATSFTFPKEMLDKGYPEKPNTVPVSPQAKEIAKQAQKDAQEGVVQVRDNSLPGKWNVQNITVVHEINGEKQKEKAEKVFNEDYCLTQAEIDASKRKKIAEKLALENMQCSTQYNEISNNDVTFKLSCYKSVPEEKFTSSVIVNGKILTLPKKNEMVLDYTLSSQKDNKPFESSKFTVQAKATYVGSCIQLKDVTKK